MLYESRMMRNQLSKAIGMIDTSVNRIKSYSFSGATSTNDTRKNTVTDKFIHLPNHMNIAHNLSNLSSNPSTNFNHASNSNLSNINNANEEDGEIDKIIEKKLSMSKRLRDRLYREKK